MKVVLGSQISQNYTFNVVNGKKLENITYFSLEEDPHNHCNDVGDNYKIKSNKTQFRAVVPLHSPDCVVP